MSIINKDGALIPGSSTNSDLNKRYSEFFGTKIVEQKLYLKGPGPEIAPTVANLIFVNPCERKMLECIGISSLGSIEIGKLDIYASGVLLTTVDFTQTPITDYMSISLNPYVAIEPNTPVFAMVSGMFAVGVTLEMHEEFRWTD